MDECGPVSSLTLNRLSVYLRCLRTIRDSGVARISSQELASRFHLSATQFRKDLAKLGDFGIRGVGYEVDTLTDRLEEILALKRTYHIIIMGMGSLGSALARHVGFNRGTFQVVAGLDINPDLFGQRIGGVTVRPAAQLAQVVTETGADIGVLAVPPTVAQKNYDDLIAAGLRGILNFAPVRLKAVDGVPTKNVDLRIDMEELAYFMRP